MNPSSTILNRIRDTELDLSDFPSGIMDKYAQQLSDNELQDLLAELDRLSRGEPDVELRRRFNSTIIFLQRVSKHRQILSAEQRVQNLAKQAQRLKRETCECGDEHIEGANYYISVADGDKTALLSGPYRTHAECLAILPSAREKAVRVDPQGHFYSFGTIAMSKTHRKRGILDPL